MSYTELEIIKKTNTKKICIVKDDSGNEWIQKTQMRSDSVDNEITLMKKLSGIRYFPTIKQIIYSGDTVSVYSTKFIETFKIWKGREVYTENTLLQILFQISSAIRIIEHFNYNHNDLFDENIMINPNTLDISIIDFGSVNNVNFVYGRDLNYFLYILIHEDIIPKKWSDELETYIFKQTGLLKQSNETDFQFGIRETNIEAPNKKTSGFEIMLWCLRKNPSISFQYTTSFFNTIVNSYIGSFVANAISMPYEYHPTKIHFDIYNGSLDTDGSLSIYDIPAGSVTEDAIFTWSIFDSIRDLQYIDIDDIINRIKTQQYHKIEPDIYRFLNSSETNSNTGLSLFFTWIVALYNHKNTVDIVMRDIISISTILEKDSNIILVNVFISLLYWYMIQGQCFHDAKEAAYLIILNEVDMEFRAVVEHHFISKNETYTNLRNILIACKKDSYVLGIQYICECRGNTDTIAMIVGAILGLIYEIPTEWKELVESVQSLHTDNVSMILNAKIGIENE